MPAFQILSPIIIGPQATAVRIEESLILSMVLRVPRGLESGATSDDAAPFSVPVVEKGRPPLHPAVIVADFKTTEIDAFNLLYIKSIGYSPDVINRVPPPWSTIHEHRQHPRNRTVVCPTSYNAMVRSKHSLVYEAHYFHHHTFRLTVSQPIIHENEGPGRPRKDGGLVILRDYTFDVPI